MKARTHAVALLVALPLLCACLVAPPATAAARTSETPLRGREPAGLIGPDEARVAWALDEAERETGRTTHVDVVVDDAGRKVSTDWIPYTPHDGSVYATEVPVPVLAEDANAPDGIVVLVAPFERTGSFVEAPGLSDRDERYLSGLVTYRFRRGSYGDRLIAVAHGLEDLLSYPQLHLLPPGFPCESETGQRVSGAAVALFAGGTVAVLLLLGYFLKGERYRQPRGPERGIGFAAAWRDAEASLSALAPRVMLFAEREMAVIGRLRNFGEGTPDGPGRRRKAEALLRQAVSEAFWEDFVAATSLIEEDPEQALPELRRLSADVEAALDGLCEAERVLGNPQYDGWPGGGENHLTRRDENDG